MEKVVYVSVHLEEVSLANTCLLQNRAKHVSYNPS